MVFKDGRSARQWVLIGETSGLVAGTAYVVDGVSMDAMDPACPQALPFHVTKAEQSDFVEDLTPLPSVTAPAGAVLRLTGTVMPGVEPGCRVFQSDEGTFVLTGPVVVPEGARVVVSGVRRVDLATTCQQGPVLEVITVTPAG